MGRSEVDQSVGADCEVALGKQRSLQAAISSEAPTRESLPAERARTARQLKSVAAELECGPDHSCKKLRGIPEYCEPRSTQSSAFLTVIYIPCVSPAFISLYTSYLPHTGYDPARKVDHRQLPSDPAQTEFGSVAAQHLISSPTS